MVRGDIGEYPQDYADDRRRSRGKSVDPVGEVHPIGQEHHDDHRHHDEDRHPKDLLHRWVLQRDDLRIVEVIVLDKGDRGS